MYGQKLAYQKLAYVQCNVTAAVKLDLENNRKKNAALLAMNTQLESQHKEEMARLVGQHADEIERLLEERAHYIHQLEEERAHQIQCLEEERAQKVRQLEEERALAQKEIARLKDERVAASKDNERLKSERNATATLRQTLSQLEDDNKRLVGNGLIFLFIRGILSDFLA